MKLDKLVGERFRERPADCAIDSHALMTRGAYMKYVASGIYSSYAPLRRIMRKIERIIREEMDAIDGQEVLFPVAMPASLLEESGRYTSIGDELLRFRDRNGSPMVLGMTHEEAAVQLVREYGQTYAKYPFMIYQVQTKFRDEQRPRGGLIRVREFIMKDAYSFHVSQDNLNAYYERCYRAYGKIFARAGIPEAIAVASDSGMMGGSVSHEFMLLTPVGEDSIVICGGCGYKANMEAAECVVANRGGDPERPLTKVSTPGMKTIDDVCAFLGAGAERSCKAVAYRKIDTGECYIVFLRGDLDINETKLKNFIGGDICPADVTEYEGLAGGFMGPCNFAGGAQMLFDNSLRGAADLCCGANEEDFHYTGMNIARDVGNVPYHDFAKAAGGGICLCPDCGKPSLTVSRGIEVGNIFQLGKKYTESMGMRFTDENGEPRYPVMGCYGIGVERLAASVCEARHDAFGPVWPVSIAPWHVHICCLRADDGDVRAASDRLYETLLKENVEAIYDDRVVSAGVMFSDADLLGVPLRVIVSPRNLKDGRCELVTRDKSVSRMAPLDGAAGAVRALLAELMKR